MIIRRALSCRSMLTTVAACLLLALAASPAPIAARGETGLIDDDAYESPNFGYEVEWSRDWEVDPESTNSSRDGDTLSLTSDAAIVVILGVAFDGAATDATAAIVSARNERYENLELLDEDGDDDLAYALIGYDFGETPAGEYLEARAISGGVVLISLTAGVDDFDEQMTLAQEEISFDGDPLFATLREGDEDAGTDRDNEDDEDSRDRDADEDDDTGRRDDDEDEDAGRSDEDEDDRSSDIEDYTSPAFGYSLEWDSETWAVDEEFSEDFDRLLLTSDGALFYIEGIEAYDGDPDDCLDDQLDLLADTEGVEEIDEIREDDGLPLSGNDDAEFVLLAVTFDDGTEYVEYLECQEIVPDEAVLVVTLLTTPEGFADEAEAAGEVLETLELEDAA